MPFEKCIFLPFYTKHLYFLKTHMQFARMSCVGNDKKCKIGEENHLIHVYSWLTPGTPLHAVAKFRPFADLTAGLGSVRVILRSPIFTISSKAILSAKSYLYILRFIIRMIMISLCKKPIVCYRIIPNSDRTRCQIARFVGPTWGPSGADRTPWTLLSGKPPSLKDDPSKVLLVVTGLVFTDLAGCHVGVFTVNSECGVIS